MALTTALYDESGHQLEESRAYFAIPSSGAGTDGTHYDPTKYGYDDFGRQRRTKAPHGTIERSVFDLHGHATEHWMGTNDSSFAGGEASGTDNMVKVSALTFDSGATGGNGWVTSSTQYVEGSTTGQRVTSYTYDGNCHATPAWTSAVRTRRSRA